MALAWTTRRQLSIFGVLAFIAVILIFIVYQSLTGPTCTDEVQNQDETGVDVGGICGDDIGEPRDLIIRWVKPFKIRTSTYEVLAVIDNPNIKLGIANLGYTIKLFDKDHILVATRDGSTFVNPAEALNILEVNISSGNRIPTSASIEFDESPRWQLIDAYIPRLALQSKKFFTEPFPHLDVTIENKEFGAVTGVRAIGVVYDESGSAIAVSGTTIEKIKSASSIDISFTWPDGIQGVAHTTNVFIRINGVL